MKVYLAGPMTGIPYFNFPAFRAAAEKLRAEGHEVFNPVEADIARHNGVDVSIGNHTGDARMLREHHSFSLREALAEDVAYICLKADAIALLPGWENSKGARAEHALASALGHTFIYLV